MDNQTKIMQVENMGFLLDRLGKDCAPLQYIRELTQNSIEAIVRAGRTEGQINWDVDDSLPNTASKLSITDNGDGMLGEEMVQYINRLNCNGHGQQALDGNYGMGAKIAAATRNHHGLIYMSWKDGDGTLIQMIRDKAGQYGLKSFGGSEGLTWFADPGDAPEIIESSGSGTKIVLLGNHANEDTCLPPEDSEGKGARWVAKYLNTRYYCIPGNIRISCREYSKAGAGSIRYATGQGPLLDQLALFKGRVSLQGATAHWWILPDNKVKKLDKPIKLGSAKEAWDIETFSHYITHGHVALLWKNELYDLRSTPNNRNPKLHQCGVIYGENRVVIYFEPTSKDITANTPRTKLVLRGIDPPWNDWAEEFRTKLPKEIQDFMDSLAGNNSARDTSTVKDRIQEVANLFQISKYRIDPAGSFEVDPDEVAEESAPINIIPNPDPDFYQPNDKPKRKSRASRILKPKGLKAKPFDLDDLPKVVWKNIQNGTRSPGDMEDKAAQYDASSNTLFINGDFRGFQCWIEFYVNQYPKEKMIRGFVTEELSQWWEQTLIETVILFQNFKTSPHWVMSLPHLTDEALTVAIMQRYHLNNVLKRAVRTKFGAPQKETETAAMTLGSAPPMVEVTPAE